MFCTPTLHATPFSCQILAPTSFVTARDILNLKLKCVTLHLSDLLFLLYIWEATSRKGLKRVWHALAQCGIGGRTPGWAT